jgi:glycosyltransferase involved in cell wall biosynthesis
MDIFLSCASFELEYGGPAFSVSRLALALAENGHRVGLWAPDGSALSSPVVRPHRDLLPLPANLVSAISNFGVPACMHDNGIWLPHNHALARFAAKRRVPRLVSLRGMVEPWAFAHKKWKKRTAWALYQARDLRRADALHATSEREASNLRKALGGARIEMIPNGVDLPPLPAPYGEAQRQAPRKALFVGRLHPVKGLPMLLEAWSQVRPGGWELHIAGPDEGNHRPELERLVRERKLTSEVTFHGPVQGDRKDRLFAQADLFVLPSHTESFGMALGEAMAHGLPVLTTTGVPWPRLASDGVGWQVEPSPRGLAEGLRAALNVDPADLRQMGNRARRLVERDFDWRNIAARFSELYAEMLA